MKRTSKRRLFFNYLISFVVFFILSGFVTGISLQIFIKRFELFGEHITIFDTSILISLTVISVVFACLGTLWKLFTVEIPLAEINKKLLKIKKGDFSTKLNRRLFSSRYSTIVNNINLMTSELSSLDSMKVSLMSNISHELKTPISVISNYATMLQDENLDNEKRIEYANAISESTKKMNELITNILKLNQLENQKIPTAMETYDLNEQLCECLLNFEEVWEEKNIEVETNLDESIFVKSDKQLFNIVWNNLLSNAFKFTPNNGKVSIEISETSKYATVTLSDTGCGIPEDQLELIFDKFYQCDSSRATDGNGLGLALVKRITNITKSYIFVESTPGKGTTFKVKIPKNQ